MAKILLDTNFLLVPAQFKVDIFEQLKEFGDDFVVLDSAVRELKIIGKRKSVSGVSARIALELIKKHNIEIVKTVEKSADNAILKFAMEHGCVVATNDKKLIKRLRIKEIKIIRLRQRKYLIIE